jgi:hypothetical protein
VYNCLDTKFFEGEQSGLEVLAAAERRRIFMNVRQANGLGRVHTAKPGGKVTYCGRVIDEEEWLITSKTLDCTGCVKGDAPQPTESEAYSR